MYKYLIIILFFNCSAFQVHEYFISMWQENYEGVPYEQIVYNVLKENPLKSGTNYLAVPWVYLIDREQLDKLDDVKIEGGFTVCGHWNYTKIIPALKKIGINVLFTPHAHHDSYQGVKIISIPHFAPNGTGPLDKDIYYSYIGASSHGVRNDLFKINNPANCIIKLRQDWHFQLSGDSKLKQKEEYQNVLARSRFSLCPRGAGHGTLRLWESLQAGAIPVLLADEYILPPGFDWNKCLIRVDEHKANNIPEILGQISIEQEKEMQKNCLKAFDLSSGSNIIKVIKDYYE
ncbi:MAG: exostosin family protein [Candidatus Babeliales bacterium]|nr:exostosin family protein [Candidatus Babeliales bacterium]